jgi:hypothetical protein
LKIVAVLCLVAAPACAGRGAPVVVRPESGPPRVPVVLVPGTTGVELVERDTGRVVWGRAWNLFFPRDGGYEAALPIGLDEGSDDGLVPGEVVRRVRLGPIVRPIYAPVVRAFETNGYRLGRLDGPRPDDTLYLLAYDWRRDNLDAVRRLAESLERLRRARGEDVLAVNLVCQSNASIVCRYYAKYGTASLDEAERGVRRLDRVRVERIVLVGTANGGALRTLREMSRGRRYMPLLGRRLRPETLFTFRSLFESLPIYRADVFLGPDGNPVDADPFRAEDWARYGWSVFDPETARRVERRGRSDLFGTESDRRSFLERQLERALRLHRVLEADPPGAGLPRYYLVQDGYRPTPERAVLVPERTGFRTAYRDERPASSDPHLAARTTAPGDGHATIESLLWLSPEERQALGAPPAWVRGGHFSVILEPAAQRSMLEFLSSPPPSLEQ